MFTQNQNTIGLTVTIQGSGTVTSQDSNINCPGACSYTYPSNAGVNLTATPGLGGTFSAGAEGLHRHRALSPHHDAEPFSVTANFTGQQDLVAHNFGNGNDGQQPVASLLSYAGKLYGTASMNGLNLTGTVFQVSSDGSETVLYNFGPAGSNDGQNPLGNLISDSAGNLYGTTSGGGIYGNGTVFELSPNQGGWTRRCCTTSSVAVGMDRTPRPG